MPIAMQWYDTEKTLLVLEFSGKWTWEEFYVQQDQINHELDKFTHDIDVITRPMDELAHSYVPLNTLTQMPIAARRAHARVRMAALITYSGLWLTMDSLLRQISRQYAERIVMVRTEEEALAKIEERRATIRFN